MEASQNILDQGKEKIRQQLIQVDALLDGLTSNQLNWQPEPGKWSIAQCIGHINLTMEPYLREMEIQIPKSIASGKKARPGFRSGFWGKRFPKMFEPKPTGKIKWKMKTMKRFNLLIPADEVDTQIRLFRENLDRLSASIEAARQVDLEQTRIVSAVSGMLKFKLGDAIGFVLAHNARHIFQAEKVKLAFERSPESEMTATAKA